MTPAERQEWERLVVAFGNAEFDCAHWNDEYDELYPHPYAHYLEAARSAKAALTAFVERLTAGEVKEPAGAVYEGVVTRVALCGKSGPDEIEVQLQDASLIALFDRVRVTRIEEGTP